MDANRQQILITSETGFPTTAFNVGSKFGTQSILFPTSCSVGAVSSNAGSDKASEPVVVDLYVSELLGKIWKLRVPYDLAGKVATDDIGSPELLFDESSYPTSITIRNMLAGQRVSSSSEWIPVLQYQLTP
jgi:hypothetical protein